MEYKKLQHTLDILHNRGFKEDCPTKDYETGVSFWHFFKYPFNVRMAFHSTYFNVSCWRVDKKYNFSDKIIN